MIPRNRPVRVAAAVGATLAAGAVAMLSASTAASADEPGRCLQNVNIRQEPDVQSRIVALCEEGTEVKLGEERDGFVRIDELDGWAAEDYVKADAPSSSSSDAGGNHESGHESGDGERDDAAHSSSGSSGSSDGDDADADRSDGSGSDGGDGSDGGGGDGGDGPDEARAGADRARIGGLLG